MKVTLLQVSTRISALLVVCTTLAHVSLSTAHAAAAVSCSPGIPCTGYDIYTQTTSGTAASLNGPKTGTPSPYTNDTGSTTTSCDGNFMNQIYSKAFMEASREVIMSEQIIHKPDSVLEYTCFDKFVSHAAENAGPIFTESTDWEDRTVCLSTGDDRATYGSRPPTCPDGSGQNVASPSEIQINVVKADTFLDDWLDIYIYDVLNDYIDDNFGHTFLGEATTIDNDIDIGMNAGNYSNCSHMSLVWDIAKCIDFGEDDRFRTYEELVNADPRSIPQECSSGNSANDSVSAGNSGTKVDSTAPGTSPTCTLGATTGAACTSACPAAGTPVSGVNTGFSNDLIRVANNCDGSTTNLNQYASFDSMQLYDEIILGVQNSLGGMYIPGTGGTGSSGTVTCADPIPTGVPVITFDYDLQTGVGPGGIAIAERDAYIHYEHICPNPGCYHQPDKIDYETDFSYPLGIQRLGITTNPATGRCIPY